MAVMRLANAELILLSPIPLSNTLRDAIGRLGEVRYVVVPEAHGRFSDEAAACYPDAQLLAAPKPPRQRRHLHFDASLPNETPDSWRGEIDCAWVDGFRLNEVVLLHRASKTLLLTDLCFHIQHSESRTSRAFFRLNDMWQRFGPSRIIRRLAVSDRRALEGSLQQILGWDFERVLPSHGEMLETGAKAALRRAWNLSSVDACGQSQG